MLVIFVDIGMILSLDCYKEDYLIFVYDECDVVCER